MINAYSKVNYLIKELKYKPIYVPCLRQSVKRITLEYTSRKITNNKQIMMEIVKQNGMLIKHASNELKDNHDVVCTALKQNGNALQYISENKKGKLMYINMASKSKPFAVIHGTHELCKKLKCFFV